MLKNIKCNIYTFYFDNYENLHKLLSCVGKVNNGGMIIT